MSRRQDVTLETLTFWKQKWYVNAPVNYVNLLIVNNKMLPLNQKQKNKKQKWYVRSLFITSQSTQHKKISGDTLPARVGPSTPPAPLRAPGVVSFRVLRTCYNIRNIITLQDIQTACSPCIFDK